MRDLDLQTLRLFAAVCEQRSIARVAEQESIVGSAISKRLAQLEDTVGTPLLLRKRRGVVPTPAGETLLEHARTMLASVGFLTNCTTCAGASSACTLARSCAQRRPHSNAAWLLATCTPFNSMARISAPCDSGTRPFCQA